MNTRRIFKSRTSRQSEVLDVLSSLLVAEIAQPSAELWIVSPWITDLDLLDNRTGRFDCLEPAWGQRQVQTSELLARAVANGGTLKVMTNETQHNARFIRQLTERVANYGMLDNLYIGQKEVLHTKGFLGDHFFLSGSMNLTIGGIVINDEQINLTTDKTAIVQALLAFNDFYQPAQGGVQ